jgi:hypothetical protein
VRKWVSAFEPAEGNTLCRFYSDATGRQGCVEKMGVVSVPDRFATLEENAIEFKAAGSS